MRLAELLALLGRSWSRLLLYPGGVAILAALVQLRRVYWGKPADHTVASLSQSKVQLRFIALLAQFSWYASLVALPWLGLALLPLPRAASIGWSIDAFMLIALLEWPRLLVATQEYRQGQITRLAAMLNSYAPLIGALLLLALPTGSLDITLLTQAPAATVPLPSVIAHWVGAAALLITLPALLGIGPFASPPATALVARIGLFLRGAGLAAVATLPFVALIPEDYPWLLPLPACGIGLLIWGVHFGHNRPALLWARVLLWVVLVEVGVRASVEALKH